MQDIGPVPVTLWLDRWQQGDETALDSLVPVVYQELRRLARAQLRRHHRPTPQPTELVAEAYSKLVKVKDASWQGRVHFFSLAARTMRTVLVDRYRQRNAQRRGGAGTLLTFVEASDGSGQRHIELDKLDDALKELEVVDPRQAEIVVLRFFGGLTSEERHRRRAPRRSPAPR